MIDLIIEILIDLIIDGGLEISSNIKISKCVRYSLIILAFTFFIVLIGICFFAAVMLYDESKTATVFFFIIGIMGLIGFIYKFKKLYSLKNKE